MGKVQDTLDDALVDWIGRQPVFFVATAPSEGGHVNLSPKGLDTFRVVDPRTVGYLDLTGSGVETIAHLRQNGRITVMLCAFEGPPRILRLFGAGTVHPVGSDGFEQRRGAYPDLPGSRAIIEIALDRIQSSCGYAVPLLDVVGQRDTLVEWADRRGPDGIADYHRDRNATSIDDLPGLPTGG